MTKTNFSKSESALDDLLLSMSKKKLLEIADQASGKVEQNESIENKGLFLLAMQVELRYLYKEHPKIYKELNIKKSWIENITKNINELTEKDWEKAKLIKHNLDVFLKKVLTDIPDDQLIALQRQKHINKRININEKWLPL